MIDRRGSFVDDQVLESPAQGSILGQRIDQPGKIQTFCSHVANSISKRTRDDAADVPQSIVSGVESHVLNFQKLNVATRQEWRVQPAVPIVAKSGIGVRRLAVIVLIALPTAILLSPLSPFAWAERWGIFVLAVVPLSGLAAAIIKTASR